MGFVKYHMFSIKELVCYLKYLVGRGDCHLSWSMLDWHNGIVACAMLGIWSHRKRGGMSNLFVLVLIYLLHPNKNVRLKSMVLSIEVSESILIFPKQGCN